MLGMQTRISVLDCKNLHHPQMLCCSDCAIAANSSSLVKTACKLHLMFDLKNFLLARVSGDSHAIKEKRAIIDKRTYLEHAPTMSWVHRYNT
jgi:hypothetical protein